MGALLLEQAANRHTCARDGRETARSRQLCVSSKRKHLTDNKHNNLVWFFKCARIFLVDIICSKELKGFRELEKNF